MKTITINKTINKQRLIAVGTLSAVALGATLTTSTPAQADSKSWKKVAIGAAVVTGYGLIKGNNKVAIAGAAATAGSYYMYDRSKDKEQARQEEARRQADWLRNRYNRNNRNYGRR